MHVHTSHLHADQINKFTTQHEHHHHDAITSMPVLYGIWQSGLPPELELKEVLDRIQVRLIGIPKSVCNTFGLHFNNSFYFRKDEPRHTLHKFNMFFGS